MASQTNRLDETFFRQPFDGGLHSNSILYYFATSPFFDPASKNAMIFGQGLSNADMFHFLTTRELFEAKVKERPGIEFVVAQEPAETGPGAGTGVWVINKQLRDDEDGVTVLAAYFVAGEDIYMAPSLADLLSSRIAAIADRVGRILPAADAARVWSPAGGRETRAPAPSTTAKTRALDASRAATPLPGGSADVVSRPGAPPPPDAASDYRVLEEALRIHQLHGHEYMDLNPVTGRPGAFHLSVSARKDASKLVVPGAARSTAPAAAVAAGAGATPAPGSVPSVLPSLNTKVAAENVPAPFSAKSTGKETKSPRTPNMPKPKRRKSKAVGTTPS
ncbi:hypothetical protein P8C59_004011 [Phyllachora maydis]|uniref:Mediator of RNA polymerase II transcription subunit 6 n=1 Tax=Phyllachora maydis TaxID=1825666 RepID=A0AAD9I358_9PEZI|nr:hypothetical protein P8C59_004011 [Phyllachora maydis]